MIKRTLIVLTVNLTLLWHWTACPDCAKGANQDFLSPRIVLAHNEINEACDKVLDVEEHARLSACRYQLEMDRNFKSLDEKTRDIITKSSRSKIAEILSANKNVYVESETAIYERGIIAEMQSSKEFKQYVSKVQQAVLSAVGNKDQVLFSDLDTLHFTLVVSAFSGQKDLPREKIYLSDRLFGPQIMKMHPFDVEAFGPHLMPNFGIVIELKTDSPEVMSFRKKAGRILEEALRDNKFSGFVPNIIHVTVGYMTGASPEELKEVYRILKDFRENDNPISIDVNKVSIHKVINKRVLSEDVAVFDLKESSLVKRIVDLTRAGDSKIDDFKFSTDEVVVSGRKIKLAMLRFYPWSSGVRMHIPVVSDLQGKLYPVDRKTNFVKLEDKKSGETLIGHPEIHGKKLQKLNDFIANFNRESKERAVIASSGNENLFWNQPVVTYSNDRIYYAVGENVEDNKYPMLVSWRDGRISIENDVRFKITGKGTNEADILIAGKRVTNQVDSATFIQLIKTEKGRVPLGEENLFWFDDLKHIFKTAVLTDKDDANIPSKEKLMSGGVFFGIDQLLDGGHILIAKAVQKPVDMDLKANVRWINLYGQEERREVIVDDADNGLLGKLIEKLKAIGYKQIFNSKVEKRGEFYIDEKRGKITIFFLENIYPFHMVGVRENGEFLDIAIDGRSGFEGVTLAEAYLLAEKLGLSRAGIIDQGNSVRLALESNLGPLPLVQVNKRFFDQDTKSTSALLYLQDKSEAETIHTMIDWKINIALLEGSI